MSSGLSRWARRLVGPAAAASGGALVLSLLLVPVETAAAAPSSAGLSTGTWGLTGLTDPVTTVAPSIEGTGGLSSADGFVCSATAATGVTTPCSSISLGGLLELTKTELVPQAPSGWSFAGWTGCPDPTGASTCLVDPSLLTNLLGTTVQPIARFVPLPLPPGSTAPDTAITSEPTISQTRSTTATTAAFGFAVVGDATNPSFECRLTGPGLSGSFTACGAGSTGTQSYRDLAPGDYTFAVRALAGGLTDATPASFAWTVLPPVPPSTSLRGGPRQNGWLLAGRVTFGLRSDRPGATYRCTVDGRAHRCGNRLVLRRVAAGTHTVSAAATDAGRTDASPARRTFTRPVNDRALRHSRGWREHLGRRGYFLGSYSQTRRAGATLSVRARHIRRVALVAATGRGFGVVKVYLGRKLLKKVSLRAPRLHRKRLVPVARFRHLRRGRLRVVVVSHGRVVRIAGLGVADR